MTRSDWVHFAISVACLAPSLVFFALAIRESRFGGVGARRREAMRRVRQRAREAMNDALASANRRM